MTQSAIARTICADGWTARVRPPEPVTEREKYMSMAAYGDKGPASRYEYDHFVPLELGGATNAPANLWPEPGAAPNRKDMVENYLNAEVCDRRLTLTRAQELIVTNWVTVYRQIAKGQGAPPARPRQGPAGCQASAAWNARYGDYDIYVRSTEPDTAVTVTGAGATVRYHTDTAGYADVYFHASEAAAGKPLTVTVGPATCHARL